MSYICFTMMPFAETFYDNLFEKIVEASEYLKGTSVVIKRADLGVPLNIAQLERHVIEYISSCDFAIAEISDVNPNVLLEVGYIMGLDKPVVLMAKKDTKIPTDLRGRYWFSYDPNELAVVPQTLANFMKSAINEILASQYKSSFRIWAHKDRTTARILEKINEVKESVLILTTNLNWHVESGLIDKLVERLQSEESLTVAILALDPEVAYTMDRAKQLALDGYTFRSKLRESLRDTEKKLMNFSERCKIAIYQTFPTQITFLIDNHVFSGVVSTQRRARHNPVFEIPIYQSGMKEAFYDHFRSVWGDSKLLDGSEPGPLPEDSEL